MYLPGRPVIGVRVRHIWHRVEVYRPMALEQILSVVFGQWILIFGFELH